MASVVAPSNTDLMHEHASSQELVIHDETRVGLEVSISASQEGWSLVLLQVIAFGFSVPACASRLTFHVCVNLPSAHPTCSLIASAHCTTTEEEGHCPTPSSVQLLG